MNSSLAFVDDPNCPKGKFTYDPRCRFWYLDTLPEKSFKTHSPRISIGKVESYLSQFQCQKFLKFNSDSKLDELHHIICIESMLSPIKDYFQNIVRASKQWYIIDPRTQAIIYNSESKEQLKSVDNFSKVELDYLQSTEEARHFNETVNQYFNKWVEDTYQSGNIEEIYKRDSNFIVFPYNRNGTQHRVILSPVLVFDKVPPIFGQESEQKRVTQVEIAYLQMNIISNKDLYDQTNELISFFQTVYIIIIVVLVILGILSIFIIIYYSIQIKNLLQAPIEHLADILKRISINKDLSDLHSILSEYESNAEEIFLSQETRELYESFYEVFQILLVTSENYFSENQTKTLVRLCKNISFFKQFENVHAVGITHNNIGNILLNQQHYLQALEHFSTSIIYAKYEIQNYCKKSQNTLLNLCLNQFSFNDDNENLNEVNLRNIHSLIGIQDRQSIYNKSNFYRKEDKINSKQFSELRTDFRLASDQTNTNNYDVISDNIQEVSGYNNEMLLSNKLGQSNQNKLPYYQYNLTKQTIYQSELNGKVYHQDLYDEQEAIDLISNLFYRKQNYIMALIAFQEHLDQNIKLTQDIYQYNFWFEIKFLLKEVLIILKYLPSSESLEATIMTQLSKCYFKLNLDKQADKYLQKSSNLLRTIQQEKYPNDIRKISIPRMNSQSYIRHNLKQSDNQNSKKLNDLLTVNENTGYIKDSKSQNQKRVSLWFSPRQSEQYSNRKESTTTRSQQSSFNYINVKSTYLINKLPQISSRRQIENIQSVILRSQQQEAEKKFDIEQLFDYKRRLSRKNENDQIFNYKIPLEVLKQIINFTKAEYLIHQKHFKTAAQELTNMLENSKVFMSHFPYRIFHKLKNIFDIQSIYSKEFNDIQNKFNFHTSTQMAIILDCNNDDTSVLQSLQLMSDLISSILTNQRDQIGIVLSNDFVQQYMQLINTQQIKQLINQIILDISQQISTQNIQDIFQKVSTLDTSFHAISNSNILSEESSQTKSNQITNENEKEDNSEIQDTQKSFENINKMNNPKIFKTHQNFTQIRFNDIQQPQNSQNNLQQYKSSNQKDSLNTNNPNSQQQKNIQQQLKVPDINIQEQSKIKSKTFDQTNNRLQQLRITNLKSSDFITTNFKSQTSQQYNYKFHFSIRKAINLLQADNIKSLSVGFSQNQKSFSKNPKKYSNSLKNYLQSQQINQDRNDQQYLTQRYIIYSTNEIDIVKNNLFDQLTLLLFKLKIQLIIISGKKGNNFLEQSFDQNYLIENEEIIKIFYSNYKLNQYLISKRDCYSKYTYSTYIQHF